MKITGMAYNVQRELLIKVLRCAHSLLLAMQSPGRPRKEGHPFYLPSIIDVIESQFPLTNVPYYGGPTEGTFKILKLTSASRGGILCFVNDEG